MVRISQLAHGRSLRCWGAFAGVVALASGLVLATGVIAATRATPSIDATIPAALGDPVAQDMARLRARKCQRLETLAAQLGETFAGFRLRETIITRQCIGAETVRAADAGAVRTGEATWSWPWANGGSRTLADDPSDAATSLAPRRVGGHGAWEVRCASNGRCAIAQDVTLNDRGTDHRASVHFVMTNLARRDRLLFRIAIDRGSDATVTGVRFVSDEAGATRPFDQCVRRQCLVEAALAEGETLASALWRGEAGHLALVTPGADMALILDAKGFRAALDELMARRGAEGALQAAR